MPDGGAPHPGVLELGDELLVELVAEGLDAGGLVVQHYGCGVVGNLALGLSGESGCVRVVR